MRDPRHLCLIKSWKMNHTGWAFPVSPRPPFITLSKNSELSDDVVDDGRTRIHSCSASRFFGVMGRKLDQQRYRYKRVPLSDSKLPYAEDYDNYRQYYSPERPYSWCVRALGRLRLIIVAVLLVVLFIALTYKRPPDAPEVPPPDKKDPLGRTPMKSLGAKLNCDPKLLKPSTSVPTNVNAVRPADIKIIGALGDSITVASGSKNFKEDPRDIYVGNSFFIGGDEKLETHITLANVIKEVNPALLGLSHGVGESQRGFNVAVGGMTALDLPRQAEDLVQKVKANKEVNVEKDWKLITIFIGTNDIGNLSCYHPERPFVLEDVYKSNIEKAISIMKNGLPRSIVTILAIWNSPLTIEANTIIKEGKRTSCGKESVKQRDDVLDEYRKAVYEIQNEKKFDSEDFTVVVQSYLDEIRDSFRNKAGKYDTSFYADDTFHLSKYGNAVMAKYLWNGLLEPVGKKNKKADLSDDSAPLGCPDKNVPFIRTLGNS